MNRVNEFFSNRYIQLALLTLGLGLLFWATLWLIFFAIGIKDFPVLLEVAVSFLGAGLLVAKYFASRVF